MFLITLLSVNLHNIDMSGEGVNWDNVVNWYSTVDYPGKQIKWSVWYFKTL